jgi:hypothetical protein
LAISPMKEERDAHLDRRGYLIQLCCAVALVALTIVLVSL